MSPNLMAPREARRRPSERRRDFSRQSLQSPTSKTPQGANRQPIRVGQPVRAVEFSRADARSPGKYRVFAETNPRLFLDNQSYPSAVARIEVGFDRVGDSGRDHYWINWVEPERSMLVGWHQDDTHPEYGEVHLQVNDGATTVEHQPADFIDSHPLDVLSQRLSQLSEPVEAVRWRNGRPSGFEF
jgi:hypothetical protein